MSDPAVIEIFKTRLLTLPSVPLLPTLNLRPVPPFPDQFLTLKRDFATVQRISIGPSPNSQFREEGTLVVSVTVKSGIGDALANTIAESVRDLFFDYHFNHFRVTVVESAVVGLADEGNYFQLDVPVRYQFDFFK